jgi:hypothetical protein
MPDVRDWAHQFRYDLRGVVGVSTIPSNVGMCILRWLPNSRGSEHVHRFGLVAPTTNNQSLRPEKYQCVKLNTTHCMQEPPLNFPSAVRWFAHDGKWDAKHVDVCRQLFGNADPNMEQIVQVQRALLHEAHRREDKLPMELVHACSDKGGDALFVVMHPCRNCAKSEQWFNASTLSCQSENTGNDPHVRACASIGFHDMGVDVQCIPRDNAPVDIGTSPPKTPPPDDSHRESMMCRACARGTSGPCKHRHTGECAARTPSGTCPANHSSCVDVPCHQVSAPCYDPTTHSCRPTMTPHVPYAKSACPNGTIKQEGIGWKDPFELHPPPPATSKAHGEPDWLVRRRPQTIAPPTSLR